jgi:hypothetical protein
MNNYTKSQKGQKGFIKKYKALGELKQIKIPESLEKDIKTVLDLLEIIAQKEGNTQKVNKSIKNIIKGLKDIC